MLFISCILKPTIINFFFLQAGRNNVIHQLLFWICADTKFLKSSKCFILFAWRVRIFSLSSLPNVNFHCFVYDVTRVNLSIYFLIMVILITVVNIYKVYKDKWCIPCTALVFWRQEKDYALYWKSTFLQSIQGLVAVQFFISSMNFLFTIYIYICDNLCF